MPQLTVLKSLPPQALREFVKWIAFGQGRYVGIRVDPQAISSGERNSIPQLASSILLAAKHPEDEAIGITPPDVNTGLVGDDADVVSVIADYVAKRHAALYREWADFEPHHAFDIQEAALNRIRERLGLLAD